jgi:hypothetical protein
MAEDDLTNGTFFSWDGAEMVINGQTDFALKGGGTETG